MKLLTRLLFERMLDDLDIVFQDASGRAAPKLYVEVQYGFHIGDTLWMLLGEITGFDDVVG